MRCNTPMMRMVSHLYSQKPFRNIPRANRIKLRRIMRQYRPPRPPLVRGELTAESVYFAREKAIATPIMNRKKGNTKSVGVHPSKPGGGGGEYPFPSSPPPAILTRIMPAMVIPRNTSRDVRRLDGFS